MKSVGVFYWYVKMPWCWCVEYGFEKITFYVQEYIAHVLFCTLAASRRAARTRGARICEKRLFHKYYISRHSLYRV